MEMIGAYAAALGGLETLISSGGIGENAATVRSRSLCDAAFDELHDKQAGDFRVPRLSGRLPQTGEKGALLVRVLKGKLIEHKHYIDRHGRDMPDIREWTWSSAHGSTASH
jgi:hypothetical protein